MVHIEKKIKVLFISRWYPHRKDPMLGLFVQRHAEAISNFCEVTTLYVQEDKDIKEKTFETEQYQEKGVFTIIVYYRKRNKQIFGKIINVINFLKAYRIGWRIIKKQNYQPDIIHVNVLTRTGLIALYFKLSNKIPYIITEHWSRYLNNSSSYKGYFRKLFTRIVVKKASAVTTVTTNLMEAMKSHRLFNDNYLVVPNVVDTEKFIPLPKNFTKSKKRIIHISCFEDVSKNISGIIRAAKKLSDRRQDFEIRLIGDGMDKKSLEDLAVSYGVKDAFVFFDGLMEGQQLVDYINTADFLILFSNYENLPVVILEAFACGLPVLSTNVGGIAEYLNEERGLLTKSGDEESFVEKLDIMLSNYFNYNSEKIREYAIHNFSNKQIGKAFTNIYKNIIIAEKK